MKTTTFPAPRNGPADTVIYAVGDIHGRYDRLLRLQGMIEKDAAKRAGKRRVLVYLGDYIDRGPDSQRVLDHLITMPLGGFETVHLRGNHEQLMLEFMGDVDRGLPWLANGGLKTMASYGLISEETSSRVGRVAQHKMYLDLLGMLPRQHRVFLRDLPTSHRIGNYLFVHAGIRPGATLAMQDDDDLLWIREPFLSANDDYGFVVVHGHTVCAEPEIRHNRICIDTGAYESGVLTALVVDGAKLGILQTPA